MSWDDCWIHICGTDSNEIFTFYWELFIDLALVASAGVLPSILNRPTIEEQQPPSLEGNNNADDLFVEGRSNQSEFAVLYFSIINGWFLYAHHFASRFTEVSRFHCVMVWMFFLSMVAGIFFFEDYTKFATAMMFQRVASLSMFVRIANLVRNAAPQCAFMAFFIADSILCYALAAADEEAATYLCGFAAMVEINIDLFCAIALSTSTQVPYRLSMTLDRFWAVILAPLGAMAVKILTQSYNGDQLLFLISSITLFALFSLLYFSIKGSTCTNMENRSPILQALLLTLLKVLGLVLWTSGGCLLLLIDSTDAQKADTLVELLRSNLQWTIALFLMLNIFTGRRLNRFVIGCWFLCWWTDIALGFLPRRKTPLTLLSTYVLIFSALTLVESYVSMEETFAPNLQTEPEDQQPLLSAAVTV